MLMAAKKSESWKIIRFDQLTPSIEVLTDLTVTLNTLNKHL
jgi:hypothetical protein